MLLCTYYTFITLLVSPSSTLCTYTRWGKVLKFLKHFESVCQMDRPPVASKQTARMSMLILVAFFSAPAVVSGHWTPAAHLLARQLHVPAGAMCALSFKWPTCFLFWSRCVELTLSCRFLFNQGQTACHCHWDSEFACVVWGDIARERKWVRKREGLVPAN